MSLRRKASSCFRSILTIISPKLNAKVTYRAIFGKKLDLDNPQTLNEKVIWLKLNDYWNNDLVKKCADKYRVRDYIKEKGCEEILIDLIATYDQVDQIEWDKLPDSFVIKLNVGCGFNIIVPDKSKLDLKAAEKKLKQWMKTKYYLGYAEMQYKDVKPIILIERYLRPKTGLVPEDYKFYCFDGDAPYVMVCTDRNENGGDSKFWYYNEKWEMQMLTYDAVKYGADATINKPDGIDEAFQYAKRLSKDFPFVRVDLYIVDGKVYFGELTFTPTAGLDKGRMPEADRILGSFVKKP